jgi:hypothetical protein
VCGFCLVFSFGIIPTLTVAYNRTLLCRHDTRFPSSNVESPGSLLRSLDSSSGTALKLEPSSILFIRAPSPDTLVAWIRRLPTISNVRISVDVWDIRHLNQWRIVDYAQLIAARDALLLRLARDFSHVKVTHVYHDSYQDFGKNDSRQAHYIVRAHTREGQSWETRICNRGQSLLGESTSAVISRVSLLIGWSDVILPCISLTSPCGIRVPHALLRVLRSTPASRSTTMRNWANTTSSSFHNILEAYCRAAFYISPTLLNKSPTSTSRMSPPRSHIACLF